MKSIREKGDLADAHHEYATVRMKIMWMGNLGCRASTLHRQNNSSGQYHDVQR
jgi:hypothetical protein